MSDSTYRRRDDFSALWPWAGNAFLLLVAAWLAYMGWAADVADLETAFYGLSGVFALLLVFGLTSAVAGRHQSPSPRAATARVPDPASDPVDGQWEDAVEETGNATLNADDERLPVNPRKRRQQPPRSASEQPVAGPEGSGAQGSAFRGQNRTASAGDLEGTAREPGEADDAEPGSGETAPPRDNSETPATTRTQQNDLPPGRKSEIMNEAVEAIRAEIAKDRAQRAARMTRFETALKDLSERVDSLSRHGEGEERATDPARIDTVAERVERLEGRVPAAEDAQSDRQAALEQRLATVEGTLDAVSALPERMERLERRPAQSASAETTDADPQRVSAVEERLQSLEATASSASRRLEWLERAFNQQSETTETVRRDELTSLANRLSEVEHATKGAVSRADIDPLLERIASVEGSLAARSDAPQGANGEDSMRSLEERLAALEASPREGTGGDGDLAEALKSYVTVTTFNNAMNTKVIPHVKELVDTRVEEELAPEALRKRVDGLLPGSGSGSGDTDAGVRRDDTLAREIDALRSELGSEREARERLQAALEETRQMAGEAAERVPAQGDGAAETEQALDSLRKARDADRRAIEALRAQLETVERGSTQTTDKGLGEISRRIDEIEAKTSRHLDETGRAVAQVRENLSAITQHVARMGENYQDIARRVERLGDPGSSAASGARQSASAQGPAVPADVDSLRDALTTIIEQNKRIREQQEMLSARFDTPTRVELDTDWDDGRS